MKKIMLGLTMLLSISYLSAYDYEGFDEYSEYSNSIEDMDAEYNVNAEYDDTLEYTSDEEYNQIVYNQEEDSQQQVYNPDEEYDQCICDHIKPDKPSTLVAILTNIGCTLFVQYIYFKEKMKIYCEQLKKRLALWLSVQQKKKMKCGKKMVS